MLFLWLLPEPVHSLGDSVFIHQPHKDTKVPLKEASVPQKKACVHNKDENMPLKVAPKAHKHEARLLSLPRMKHDSQGGTCDSH